MYMESELALWFGMCHSGGRSVLPCANGVGGLRDHPEGLTGSRGKILERLTGEELAAGKVKHPYTKALLAATPSIAERKAELVTVSAKDFALDEVFDDDSATGIRIPGALLTPCLEGLVSTSENGGWRFVKRDKPLRDPHFRPGADCVLMLPETCV